MTSLTPRPRLPSLVMVSSNTNTVGTPSLPTSAMSDLEISDSPSPSLAPETPTSALWDHSFRNGVKGKTLLKSALLGSVGVKTTSCSTASTASNRSSINLVGTTPTSSAKSCRLSKRKLVRASLPTSDFREYGLKPQHAAWLMRQSRLTQQYHDNLIGKFEKAHPDLDWKADKKDCIRVLWRCYRALDDDALSASLERLGFEPNSWPEPRESVKAWAAEQQQKKVRREEKRLGFKSLQSELKKKQRHEAAMAQDEELRKK